MRKTIAEKIVAVTIISASLSACAGAPRESHVAPACSETIGLNARLGELHVGEQRVLFSVFPQQADSAALTGSPDLLLRLRFFRLIPESPELTQPGQELRLYTPERPPVVQANAAPFPTPFGVSRNVHAYEATVAFDKPGTWGVEVFVRAGWQISPAMTTLMFRVGPALTNPTSARPAQPSNRVVYFGTCSSIRLEPSG